ncbi:MAG TPA: glucose-6-phosphate dehydrogenase, partial [Caulobacteraceae bacterium]|nr:glucose-6-phosphate dehydrogenase [Caulobacteraceae bacterium]
AVSPTLFAPIVAAMKASGLAGPGARIVLEKPVGRDLHSFREIDRTVRSAFPEERILRIDHYLGKETVQNLLALRFANVLFEPLWNSLSIEHVQITVAETQGVGDRWPYYDEYGALRDMLQNHMLQLLCLLAMEPPSQMDPEAVRNEKVKVLRSLRPVSPERAALDTVRGQYRRGVSGDESVTGYEEERGGPTDTETFVAIKAYIDNWRWANTPFYLRTGKRMARRRTEIVVQFKPVPHLIFEGAGRHDVLANRLVIELQPEEDISLLLMNKTPGLDRPMRLQALPLSLSWGAAGERPGRRGIAYERLLLDAMSGDSTLFVRRDEAEAAWEWVDGVSAAWAQAAAAPRPYVAGSWGPREAFDLIERDGRAWHG